MYTPDVRINAAPTNIEAVGRSPKTKTPKIRRNTMREYLKGIIAESSPKRKDVMSKRYPKDPKIIMLATTTQSISGGKSFSPLKNTQAVVNGNAAIIVKVAILEDGISGGVSLVTKSLIEKAISATTAQITA